MRRFLFLLSLFVILSGVRALEANAIAISVLPDVQSTEFNVSWDVNNANADWNHFVVAFTFGSVVNSDLDQNWTFPVGIDFNSPMIDINSCSADVNDANIYHCNYEANVLAGNFLRNGTVFIRVYGWKDDGNTFYSDVNTTISSFSDISASVSGFSSLGELNVTVSFSCDVNADVNAFEMNGIRPASVTDDGNSIVITFTDELPRFGYLLEVNRADVNAACALPFDTNTVVRGLPNDYYTFTPGWSTLLIPFEIDTNYPYLSTALSDLYAIVEYNGTGWTPADPLADPDYVLRTYLAYADRNVVVPVRYRSSTPSACPGNVVSRQLSSGWNLLPVYCTDGVATCSELNSTLYYLSFVEFNSASGYVLQRPLFSAIAVWNAFGSAPTPVFDFSSAPDVNNIAAYWVWINPNWLQGGMSAYYYGRCLTVPAGP